MSIKVGINGFGRIGRMVLRCSLHHPGLLTAALLGSRLTIELIADGVHIHPAVLEMALRLKAPDNVVATSLSRNVGTPEASAASSSSRMVAKP